MGVSDISVSIVNHSDTETEIFRENYANYMVADALVVNVGSSINKHGLFSLDGSLSCTYTISILRNDMQWKYISITLKTNSSRNG